MEIPQRIDLHQLWFPLKWVVFNDPWGGIGDPCVPMIYLPGFFRTQKNKKQLAFSLRVQPKFPKKINTWGGGVIRTCSIHSVYPPPRMQSSQMKVYIVWDFRALNMNNPRGWRFLGGGGTVPKPSNRNNSKAFWERFIFERSTLRTKEGKKGVTPHQGGRG